MEPQSKKYLIRFKKYFQKEKPKKIELKRDLPKEITGDIWNYIGKANAICICTNRKVVNGKNIMGKGIAKEAKELYPELPEAIAISLRFGDGASIVHKDAGTYLVSFPTKNSPYNKSDLELIRESCFSLQTQMEALKWKRVIIPRPGCGCGGLSWEREVKPFLKKLPIWKLPVQFISKE